MAPSFKFKQRFETFAAAAVAALAELRKAYESLGVFPGVHPPTTSRGVWARTLLDLPDAQQLGILFSERCAAEDRAWGESEITDPTDPVGMEPIRVSAGSKALYWLLHNSGVLDDPSLLLDDQSIQTLSAQVEAALASDEVTWVAAAFLLGLQVDSDFTASSGWELRHPTPEEMKRLKSSGRRHFPVGYFRRAAVLSVSDSLRRGADNPEGEEFRARLTASLSSRLDTLHLHPDLEFSAPVQVLYKRDLFDAPHLEFLQDGPFSAMAWGIQVGIDDGLGDVEQQRQELDELVRYEWESTVVTAKLFQSLVTHAMTIKQLEDTWPKKGRTAERLDIAAKRCADAASRLGAVPTDPSPDTVEELGRLLGPLPDAIPQLRRAEEEHILLDLLIALEALLGADDASGEQDRLKRRAAQLVSADGMDGLEVWRKLRDMWKLRNEVLHGKPPTVRKGNDLSSQLRWLRRVACAARLRLLEIVSIAKDSHRFAGRGGFDMVYERLDQAAIDPEAKRTVDSMKVEGLIRPGRLKPEAWILPD